ncbi:LytTR family DNA-binding domain-containing protein [uncultured Chryseobacterium sp.]|uniref:LytR/AlgR family response regulator transcription factor n=1 Tax=uncultured Chryseobacterium sp. TaxID=259322 RepID=UPI0025DB8131|nr:LytTR family DNA-binding domain-containing protein [uncultured Chryseobacterium sp.]
MIKCILVDDEPLAISLLENHISKMGELKIVATCNNALEAYRILRGQQVDLMFLDIQMPDLNGIEFFKSLDKKPAVIFTTAHRDYALEGFELQAVDYLLKPITFERFFRSVQRMIRQENVLQEPEFMIFRSGGFSHKILLKDILYFESFGNDLKVYFQNTSITVSKSPVSEFAHLLLDKDFVRIHRSFLVNTSHITSISSQEILMGNISIPVGRSYKKEFEDFARKFLGN